MGVRGVETTVRARLSRAWDGSTGVFAWVFGLVADGVSEFVAEAVVLFQCGEVFARVSLVLTEVQGESLTLSERGMAVVQIEVGEVDFLAGVSEGCRNGRVATLRIS